jgi:hypothetical protein
LNQQQFVMRPSGGQRSSGSVEDPSYLFEAEQIPIEPERLLEILDVKHDVTQIVRFHDRSSRAWLFSSFLTVSQQ